MTTAVIIPNIWPAFYLLLFRIDNHTIFMDIDVSFYEFLGAFLVVLAYIVAFVFEKRLSKEKHATM